MPFHKKKKLKPFQYQKPQESLEEAFGYLATTPGLERLSASDLQRQLRLNDKFGRKQLQQQLDFTRQFQPEFVEAESEGIAARRKADAAMLKELGPILRRADEQANPQRTAMMRELYGQKMAELQAGGGLTPQEQRTTQQDVRAAQQARGLTQGSGPVREEALLTTRERERRRSNRQRAATQFLGTMNTQRLNPTNMIMGQGRQTPNILGAPNVGQSQTGGGLYGGVAESIFDINQKQAMENHHIRQANKAAGGGLGGLGSIVGTIGGSMIGMPMLGGMIGGAAGGAAGGGGWGGAIQGGLSGMSTGAGKWGDIGAGFGRELGLGGRGELANMFHGPNARTLDSWL
jgi:hypothetical protein